ncbi:hypothetical protein ES703_106989 [subsurface metagenome]
MGFRVASAGLLRIEAVACKENVDVWGSVRRRAVGVEGGQGRQVVAALFLLSFSTSLARKGLRRRREMACVKAVGVCGLSVFYI